MGTRQARAEGHLGTRGFLVWGFWIQVLKAFGFKKRQKNGVVWGRVQERFQWILGETQDSLILSC